MLSLPADEVNDSDDTLGVVMSTVTLLTDATDRLPAASAAYTLYVPAPSPVAGKVVSVLAVKIETLFHLESSEAVMLTTSVTVIVDKTKYAVPTSVLRTVANPKVVMLAAVTLAVGAVVSTRWLGDAAIAE